MARTHDLHVRVDEGDLAVLDGKRLGAETRSQTVRRLLFGPTQPGEPRRALPPPSSRSPERPPKPATMEQTIQRHDFKDGRCTRCQTKQNAMTRNTRCDG